MTAELSGFGSGARAARLLDARTVSKETEKSLRGGKLQQRRGERMVQNVILVFFRRRLSQRPAVEELESRNILKRECQPFRR